MVNYNNNNNKNNNSVWGIGGDTFSNSSQLNSVIFGGNTFSNNSQLNTGNAKEIINYLELDDYMTALDDKSLNKLTTAQLMQRLKSHNLPYKGLKHELIQRWKSYKLGGKNDD